MPGMEDLNFIALQGIPGHFRFGEGIMVVGAKAALVLRYLTIVPAAHYRAWDVTYQRRLYALFHTSTACKVLHSICTPIAIWFMLAALWHVEVAGVLIGGAPLRLSLLLAALFAAYAFSHDRLVGVLLLPVYATLWFLASAFAERQGPAGLSFAIGGLFTASALQTASHFFEPVPPPLSGSERFIPFTRFWRTASAARKALALLLASSVYVLLELYASPRVFPCQALFLLQKLGYRGPLREETEREARRMRESSSEVWSE